MADDIREPPLGGLANHSDHNFDLIGQFPEFYDDALLAIAYVITAYLITFIGPLFWACLIWLFFIAEVGAGIQTHS